MKRSILGGLGLACLILAAGCSQRSLVGNWELGSLEVLPGASAMMTFNQDGTAKMTIFAAKTGLGANISIEADGKYTLEGDKLTVTMDKVGINGIPAVLKPSVEPRINDEMKKPQVYTMVWKSDNEIELKADGDRLTTITRMKPGQTLTGAESGTNQ